MRSAESTFYSIFGKEPTDIHVLLLPEGRSSVELDKSSTKNNNDAEGETYQVSCTSIDDISVEDIDSYSR